MNVLYRRSLSSAIIALLCACSGGGQSAIPHAATGVTLPTANTRSVQLGAQETTVTLPVVSEISGTLVFPAVSATATVSLNVSATAPAGVGLDTRRRTQSGTLTVYEYVTIVPATTISLPSIPAMTFTLPATTPLTGSSLFYGISDVDSRGGKISFDTQGPGTTSGQTITFAQIATPLTLQAGHSYTFVLYGTTAKPAGASKIYVTNDINFGSDNPSGVVRTYNADGTTSTPTIQALNFANAIAVDAKAKIYVDYSDIKTFTADGKPATPVVSAPFPITGYAVDRTGRILVTQYQAGVGGPGPGAYSLLSVYSAAGSDTGVYITAGLSDPRGVAVAPNGKIDVTNSPYVAGQGAPNITTYTGQGAQTTPTITSSLKDPGAIAIDAAGKLYVADSNSIKTFLPDGTPTTPTITQGISGPIAVAIDAAGKIYVANSIAHNVTTYGPDGTQAIPTIATDPNLFLTGVAVR